MGPTLAEEEAIQWLPSPAHADIKLQVLEALLRQGAGRWGIRVTDPSVALFPQELELHLLEIVKNLCVF